MPDSRKHERWIWYGDNHEHLYPIETAGKPLRAICVFGPDTIHPQFGFNWWQKVGPKDLDAAVSSRDSIANRAYAEIKASDLSLAESIEYADSVHDYQCFGLCETFEDLCSLFDYWVSLGGCPYGVSDSDVFSLSDAIVTTYAPDCSDVWSRHEDNV